MTKVLQVMGRSAGGIAKHVADIAAALDGDGDLQVDIAAPGDLPVAMPKEVIEVTIPDGPVLGHRAAVSLLREAILKGSYDVVHAHGLRAGIDASAASGGKVEVFMTVHNLVRPEIAGRAKAPLYRWAERISVARCDRVLCVSEEIARHLKAQSPRHAHKIEVAYLGVEEPPPQRRSSAEIREGLNIPTGAPLVATASRLSAQKALGVMFRAVEGIPGAHLVVLGEGPQREELEQLAASLLGERVHFLGFRDDVVDHIRAADAFCLSSVWEGVPLAAQEAILVGTVVVGTDVGGMSELITDGHSGRLVPNGDHVALASALTEVLNDVQRRTTYAERARAQLIERFSRKKMLVHLADAYREAAGES